MTPNGPASIYDPPSASSSEEEDESEETMTEQKQDLSEDEVEEEEEVQEETDDDEEIPQPPEEIHDVKKPIPSQLSLPQESEDEDEDTESEDFDMQSVPSPSVSNFTIKPSTTSTFRSVDNSSRPSGKADPPAEDSQPRYSSKRPMENGNGTPNKRGKSMNGGEEKSGNTRLWSENDQIAVLKGIIDYHSNTGNDPLSDAAAFHEVMKKSLHLDVSKGQMMDKIRRMKKKYQINAEKGENGQDPFFTKPHDSQLFELSKRIWGVNGVTMTVSRKSKGSINMGSMKKKVNKDVKVENPPASSQEQETVEMEELVAMKEETEEDFWKKYPLLEKSLMEIPVMHKEFVKKAMRMAGSSNANELEENWRKLEIEEMELYKKKIDLTYLQTKMVLQHAFK